MGFSRHVLRSVLIAMSPLEASADTIHKFLIESATFMTEFGDLIGAGKGFTKKDRHSFPMISLTYVVGPRPTMRRPPGFRPKADFWGHLCK